MFGDVGGGNDRGKGEKEQQNYNVLITGVIV